MRHKFVNPYVRDMRRGLFDYVLWKIGYFGREAPKQPVPDTFTYLLPFQNYRSDLPSAIWINHDTYLVSVDGIGILTDPIWSQRCSPISFIGPKRKHPPALSFSELPNIQFIFISHDHYDHLDKKTVLLLTKAYPHCIWIVPKGVKRWFASLQVNRVWELGWWEPLTFHGQLRVTSVPAQHYSGRRGVDLNRTLWSGWVIEFLKSGKRLFFTGDTGYNPYDFQSIGKRWKGMDLSLIPIGSYLPRSFMAAVHVNPDEAVQIHIDVYSKLSLAMHWKTFHLSDEPPDQPPYDLYLALQRAQIDHQIFLAPSPGYAINW